MSDQSSDPVDQPPPPNGAFALNGAAAEAIDEPRKKKKQRKKEEKKRRALLERFPEHPPHFEAGQPRVAEPAPTEDLPGRRIQDWLRPASRNLNNHQLVAAQKSSALIAINCLMLSLAGLSIYRTAETSELWLALVPLALTNCLSMIFAILSAQTRFNTTLDELCAMPSDEYEAALNEVTRTKNHLNRSLKLDLHQLGRDLARRQGHLHTAYNVLLGGIPLSTLMFGVCVALTSRS